MRLVKDWGGKTGLRTVGRPRKKAGKKRKGSGKRRKKSL
jgi:hypothetical protein